MGQSARLLDGMRQQTLGRSPGALQSPGHMGHEGCVRTGWSVGRETQRRQAACLVKKYAAMHQSNAAQKTPYARGMAVTEPTPAEAGPG